jgi:hydroxyacylglutathione hydrolase
MIVKRFYDEKLAQASYLIGCAATGEALVVDANRDLDQYLEMAEAEGVRITHVSETHIHADYVSGSRELAQRTGAQLYLSDEGDENWKYAFAEEAGAILVKDGDHFQVGNIRIAVMHTPGHTPEHISFLVTDGAAADRPIGALTGDFVFVGDVGRPDLLEKAAGVTGTMEAGARVLFHSLERFKEQPDYLQIWPGHGAGSACGKGLSSIPTSTVGYERLFNWAFQIDDEEEFVAAVLEGQPEPPKYFAEMKRINKVGPAILSGFRRPERLTTDRLAEVLGEVSWWWTPAPPRPSRPGTSRAPSTSRWTRASPRGRDGWCRTPATSTSSPTTSARTASTKRWWTWP